MSQPVFTKHIISCFLLFLLVSFVVINQGITEEHNTILSGHITTREGEPISDATVLLLYMEFNKNPQLFKRLQTLQPIYDGKLYPFLTDPPLFYNKGKFPDKQDKNDPPPYLESKSDSNGKFSFFNISSKLVQLVVLQKDPLEYETTPNKSGRKKHIQLPIVHSLKIDKVTFFPQQNTHFPPIGAVTFTIEQGRKIENVELIVSMENPLNIRGRILYKNGTPLSDTTLSIKIGHHNFNYANDYPYRIPVAIKTDENGNFIHNLYYAGIYAFSTNYRGLSAISDPFFINGVTPHDVIELKLDGNPDDIDNLKSENANKEKVSSIRFPQLSGVWILNPENGHVYKRILCKTREDAKIQAAKEDAHLVSITSEKEQIWLESVFGTSNYWIGLTGHRNIEDWVWDTGEKVKYKNWIKDDLHRPPPAIFKLFGWVDDKPKGKNVDYAIMTRDEENGYMKWKVIEHRHSEQGYTRLAVIEKDSINTE